MASPWTINNVSLDTRLVKSARLQLRSQVADLLNVELSMPVDESPWAHASEIVLRNGSTVVFRGKARTKSGAASGREEAVALSAAGPWEDLERCIYIDASDFTDLVVDKDTLANVLPDILSRAAAQGCNIAQGTLSLGSAKCPQTRFDNASFSQIVQRLLYWSPGAIAWYDYTQSPPQLNVVAAHSATALSVALAGSKGVQIQPRYDLVVAGCKIIYRKPNQQFAGYPLPPEIPEGGGDEYSIVSIDTAGSTSGPGVATFSVDLLEGESAPTGIASAVYNAAQQLGYTGKITIQEEECSTPTPGRALNITGGSSEWAAMAAPIYGIHLDLMTGRTTYEFGPNGYLGVQDLLQLLREAVRHNSPEGSPSYNNPGGGGGGDSEEESAALTINIKDPDDETVPDAYFSVGGSTYANGATANLPPGSYTVLFAVLDLEYIPPDPEEVTLAADGDETRQVTATWRDRLKMRRADGQEGQALDVNMDDIPDTFGDDDAVGNQLVKLRLTAVAHLGQPGKTYILRSATVEDA